MNPPRLKLSTYALVKLSQPAIRFLDVTSVFIDGGRELLRPRHGDVGFPSVAIKGQLGEGELNRGSVEPAHEVEIEHDLINRALGQDLLRLACGSFAGLLDVLDCGLEVLHGFAARVTQSVAG